MDLQHLLLLLLGVYVSSQERQVLHIGVVAGRWAVEGVTNHTIASTSVWTEHLAVRLHRAVVDSGEIYGVLQTVKDFRQIGMDSVFIDDELQHIGHLPDEMFIDDIPLLALGRVSPHAALQIHEECSPPFTRPGYHHLSETKAAKTYLESNVMSTLILLRWTTVIILYEKDIELYIDQIIWTLSEHGMFVIAHEVDSLTSDELYHLMQKIDGSDPEANVNITVICHTTCTQSVLSTAGEYVRTNLRRSSLSMRSLWLLFQITDDSNLDQILEHAYDYDNVVVVSLPGFFVDKSDEIIDILQLVRRALNHVESNYTVTSLSRGEILYNIHRYIQAELQHCHWSPMKTLMWTREGRGWSNVGHLNVLGQTAMWADMFPNTGFGFNGRKFRISTLEWAPFVTALPNNTYSGLCFDLLKHMASSLNFTFEVVEPADGDWGVITDNGSWTGLVGQLARLEVDLVAAPLATQANREKVMDFTYSFYIDYTTILMKKPDPLKTKWRTIIDPFSEELLISLIISLPVVSLLLFLFERFSPYYDGSDGRDGRSGLHTYLDAFWYMYGALLTQGGARLPRSQTGRTLLSSWWLFCIIMMATYSGNLIAFLTVNKEKPLFTTVAEMVRLQDYVWGTVGGTLWVTAFNETRAPDLMQAWAGILKFNSTDPSVLSTKSKVHFDRVLSGGYFYIGDKTQMEIITATECSLLMAEDQFMPLQYAIGLPNFSPYTKIFSDELLHAHESGLMQIWKTRRWPKRNFCDGKLVTEAKQITVVDVQSAFYLIALGVGMAVVVVLMEKANFFYKNSCKARTEVHGVEPSITVTFK